jgi:hypothetical protein
MKFLARLLFIVVLCAAAWLLSEELGRTFSGIEMMLRTP